MKSRDLLKIEKQFQRFYLELENHRVLMFQGYFGEKHPDCLWITPEKIGLISIEYLDDLLIEHFGVIKHKSGANIIEELAESAKKTFYITGYGIENVY